MKVFHISLNTDERFHREEYNVLAKTIQTAIAKAMAQSNRKGLAGGMKVNSAYELSGEALT